MVKKFPLNPPHPERICWGCDRYCAASDMACGNGSSRAQHPVELFGADWLGAGSWAEETGGDEAAAAARPKAKAA